MTYRIRIAVRSYLPRSSKLVLAVTARLIFCALVGGQAFYEGRIHPGSTDIGTGALSARQERRICPCEPLQPGSTDLPLSASELKDDILIRDLSSSEA
jgi:hypothetical protein